MKPIDLLPNAEGAIRNIDSSIRSGLRILGKSDEDAMAAHRAIEAMTERGRENLFNFTWSNLANHIIRVADERVAAAKSKQPLDDEDNEDERDDEVEPPLKAAAMPFTITVTIDDEAALALNTLVVAGAKTNAEVIGHALKFYLAALQHHAKQLDELNKEEGEGY